MKTRQIVDRIDEKDAGGDPDKTKHVEMNKDGYKDKWGYNCTH